MKKIISILLCIILVFVAVSFNAVAAEMSPTITVGNSIGKPGDNIDVKISIADNPGILAMAFCVSYDSNILEYTGYKNGYLTNYTIKDHPDKGMVSFVSVEEAERNENGTLLTLVFKIKDTADYGEYEIGIVNNNPEKYGDSLHNSFANAKEQFIVPVVNKGMVTVTDKEVALKGDVNSDGKINNRDLVLFTQYLADWDVTIELYASDTNSDGKINNRDLVLLTQYLADWDVEFK